MRHHHMRCIAAVDLDPDLLRLQAQMFVTARAETARARAAADPRVNHHSPPSPLFSCIGASGFDGAFDFMPEREGQGTSAGELKLPPAAEVEEAFVQMNVGVADPAMADAHEDLATLRFGNIAQPLA